MPFQSPGGEAVKSILDMLTERERTKQQQLVNQHTALQDQIDQQREARAVQAEQDTAAYRMQSLQEAQRKEAQAESERKQKEASTEVEKRFGPTDIPTSPEDVALVKASGVETSPVSVPVPTGGLMSAPQMQPVALRIAGTYDQRAKIQASQQKLDQDKKRQQFIADLNDPSKLSEMVKNPVAFSTTYQEVMGHPLPADVMAQVAPKSSVPEDVYALDEASHALTKVGAVPTGSRITNIPRPPASASGDVSRAQSEASYNHREAELSKLAAPWDTQAAGIKTAEDALSQNNAQSDALAAPAIMRALGNNRMSESEIKRIMGARSAWDSLQVQLSKIASDPNHTVQLSPTQRRNAQRLLSTVKGDITSRLDIIDQANNDLIDAGTDVTAHKKIVQKARQDLNKGLSGGGAFSVDVHGKGTVHFKSQAELDAFKADLAAAGIK